MSYLFIYLNPKNLKNEENRIKLELNEDSISSITVEQLKDKLTDQLDLLQDQKLLLPKNYDLTFFGRRLKCSNQLSNYGVKTGAFLFVLPSDKEDLSEQTSSKEKKAKKIDQQEIAKKMVTIRTALVNSSFRSMLNRLYDKEFRDNIVACTPELRNNIIAFAILQDPELLMMVCTDNESLPKITEKYSVFAEAAVQLAAAFHEEMIANSAQSNGNSNTVFGPGEIYSLQNYSDDELEGVDAAPPAGQQVRETQPIIQNRITSDMVQQAIQAAARSELLTEPSTSQQSNVPNQSNSTTNSSSLNSTTANQRLAQYSSRDWSQQLTTMREFGLQNNAIAIQALEACNGNVQDAINLYFVLNNQAND